MKDSILREFGLAGENAVAENEQSIGIAVDKATELLKNWSYLQTEQMKAQLTDAVYHEEMKRLKESFQSTLSDIDQKNKVLVEVLKRANTATDKEELRKALTELAEIPADRLTEADF